MSDYKHDDSKILQTQVPAYLNDLTPGAGDWVELLNYVGAGEVDALWIFHNNDENDARDVQVQVTIDGVIMNALVNMSIVDNTTNFIYLRETASPLYQTITTTDLIMINMQYSSLKFTQSILIEVRIQTVGTNENLRSSVGWSLYP